MAQYPLGFEAGVKSDGANPALILGVPFNVKSVARTGAGAYTIVIAEGCADNDSIQMISFNALIGDGATAVLTRSDAVTALVVIHETATGVATNCAFSWGLWRTNPV